MRAVNVERAESVTFRQLHCQFRALERINRGADNCAVAADFDIGGQRERAVIGFVVLQRRDTAVVGNISNRGRLISYRAGQQFGLAVFFYVLTAVVYIESVAAHVVISCRAHYCTDVFQIAIIGRDIADKCTILDNAINPLAVSVKIAVRADDAAHDVIIIRALDVACDFHILNCAVVEKPDDCARAALTARTYRDILQRQILHGARVYNYQRLRHVADFVSVAVYRALEHDRACRARRFAERCPIFARHINICRQRISQARAVVEVSAVLCACADNVIHQREEVCFCANKAALRHVES